MKKIPLGMAPGRICYGLSKIGYTPDSAICDIADNSVTAGAAKIYIKFKKINEHANDKKRNNIKEYLIIDDGKGMTQSEIINALDLGSDMSQYSENSLSKFGLGLKSAAFAQGQCLEVISGIIEGEFHKLIVNLKEIVNEYFAYEDLLQPEDKALINEFLPNGHGTIIRIANVYQNNHPSIDETKKILEKRLGVIYYYFLKDGMQIFLDGKEIQPFDVLFTEEADQNGNLDEAEWDGKSVKWISKKKKYMVDTDAGISCEIEATQLPYPPIFELDGISKNQVREKYNIGAGNYGYYIYRNKRLISWAHKLDGIIKQEQNYYAFRGRILIESDADDCFNIDVKKSNVVLSREAYEVIDSVSDAFKKKSSNAWKHAYNLVKKSLGITPNQQANDIAAAIEEVDDLPADMDSTEAEDKRKEERKEYLINKFKKEMEEETKKRIRNETGKTPEVGEITQDEIDETLRGENRKTDRIFPVELIEYNILWAPYYDADKRECVRINQSHRFARLLYEDNGDNTDLQILMGLLFWQMASAELYIRTHNLNLSPEVIEEVMTEYRRVASELLANLCRNREVNLPPFTGDQL